MPNYRDLFPNHIISFTEEQRRTLVMHLGTGFPIERLEHITQQHLQRVDDGAHDLAEHQEMLREQTLASKSVSERAQQLLMAIELARKVAPGAAYAGYLDSREPLEAAHDAAVAARAAAERWSEKLKAATTRRRGLPHPERRELAAAVAQLLRTFKIEPSTTREGSFKRGGGKFYNVLKVVYEAAGIAEPVDLFDDLKYAVDAASVAGAAPASRRKR
jgi:hypothetical protein